MYTLVDADANQHTDRHHRCVTTDNSTQDCRTEQVRSVVWFEILLQHMRSTPLPTMQRKLHHNVARGCLANQVRMQDACQHFNTVHKPASRQAQWSSAAARSTSRGEQGWNGPSSAHEVLQHILQPRSSLYSWLSCT